MPKLVIVSDKVLEIGKVYRGLILAINRPEPDQCFLVVADSTAEGWVDCLATFGKDSEWSEILTHIGGPWYYYEIKTD